MGIASTTTPILQKLRLPCGVLGDAAKTRTNGASLIGCIKLIYYLIDF